jgi:hypothetical protein
MLSTTSKVARPSRRHDEELAGGERMRAVLGVEAGGSGGHVKQLIAVVVDVPILGDIRERHEGFLSVRAARRTR